MKIIKAGTLVMLCMALSPAVCTAEQQLPAGWKQDRTLSNNNRLVFRNETANAVLEVKEIPSDGHSAKLIAQALAKEYAQALANKANCFKLENIGSSYIITCDQIDTFTRVTVKDQTAEISTITCHEQTTCDAAVKILKNIDL